MGKSVKSVTSAVSKGVSGVVGAAGNTVNSALKGDISGTLQGGLDLGLRTATGGQVGLEKLGLSKEEAGNIDVGGTLTGSSAQAKTDIISDIKIGEGLLGKDFKEGNLDRLSTAPSADMADIIARRKAGLEGLSAEENQALRERGSQEIDRGSQTALRQLRGLQGASGVRGASAVAGQANILQAGQSAKAGVERDLLIQNVNQKREALSGLEQTVQGAEADQLGREQFNIGQREKEIAGRQAAGLGFAALGATERGSQRGVSVALANAKAAGSGGKK